jgi:hypothetical protein
MNHLSDIKTSKIKKPLTERQLEKAIRDTALKLGYLTYKFTSPSNRGVPDRIFINPHGYVFFIEFKSKIGKLTALQKKVHEDFGKRRVSVYVINDLDKGVKILKILQDKKYIALTK